MSELLQEWRKATLKDLRHITSELKEFISTPAVIILSGELGVGKTTFLKEFTQDVDLSSPSYSLINEAENYTHADFYRLESPDEIDALELDVITEGKEYVFVEWGIKYEALVRRLLGNTFSFYELQIDLNEFSATYCEGVTRNFCLYQL